MNNIKDIRLYFLTLLVICTIVFIYTPVFGPNFAYLNDYTAFMPLWFGFPETVGVFQLGRPIQAILANIQFRFLGDMLSLQMMRIFIVLMIATAATLFFRFLQKNLNINIFSAVLLSLLTFTLPSMTINSFFIAQSVPGIVPLFFVLPAHYLIQKSNTINHNRILIITAVFMLIFLSLLTYPPVTFFFLTLTFIKFVFGTKDPSRAKLADIYTEVMIFSAAIIAYFLFVKFIYKPIFLGPVTEGGVYAFTLSSDPFAKLTQVIDLFVLDFSAWFPPLNWIYIIPLVVVFILICTWASLCTPYNNHLRNSSKITLGITLPILIPILTSIPVLAIQGDYPILYRISFASMAAIMPVAIVFVIDRVLLVDKRRIVFVPALFVISVLIALAEISSHHRLVLEVARLSAEYQHVFDTVTYDNNTSHNNVDSHRVIRSLPLYHHLILYICIGILGTRHWILPLKQWSVQSYTRLMQQSAR